MFTPARLPAHKHFLISSTTLSGFGLAVALMCSSPAMALPTGGTVAPGNGNVTITNLPPNTTYVKQIGKRAVIDWTSFNTAPGETVRFDQYNAAGTVLDNGDIALNRINDSQKTLFNGALQSNGQVYLVNQHGFVFGHGFSANVGGLLVSTAGINNTSATGGFMDPSVNTFHFYTPGDANAAVVFDADSNTVQANYGGYIAVLASKVQVSNTTLRSTGGTVALGSAKGVSITVDPVGDGLISYEVTDPTVSNSLNSAIRVENGATIDVSNTSGNAGQIIISANVMDSIYNNVVLLNNAKLDAHSASAQAGTISIGVKTDDTTANHGIALNDVTLDAHTASGQAGTIAINETLNNSQIGIGTNMSNATLDASSTSGKGGRIQITTNANNTTATHLVNIDGGSFLDDTSSRHIANDGIITINGRHDGVYDNDITGVSFDGTTALDPSLRNIETIGSDGSRNVQHGNESVIRPCSTVNGQYGCNPGASTPPPPPAPSPAPAPSPSPAPNPGPSADNSSPDDTAQINQVQAFIFQPLDRPVLSLRDDETQADDPSKFTYTQPYFTNRLALNLSILEPAGNAAPRQPVVAANLSPEQLGTLAPAAGGDLNNLAPAAGGAAGASISCINAALDSGWNRPAGQPVSCQPTTLQ